MTCNWHTFKKVYVICLSISSKELCHINHKTNGPVDAHLLSRYKMIHANYDHMTISSVGEDF